MARPVKDKERAALKTAEDKLRATRNAAYRVAEKSYKEEMAPVLLKVRAARAKAVARKNAAAADAEAVYYNGIAKLRSVK